MFDPAHDARALWRTLPPAVQERLGALTLGHSLFVQRADDLDDNDPEGIRLIDLAADAMTLVDEIVAGHFGQLLDEGSGPDLDGLDLVLSGGQLS